MIFEECRISFKVNNIDPMAPPKANSMGNFFAEGKPFRWNQRKRQREHFNGIENSFCALFIGQLLKPLFREGTTSMPCEEDVNCNHYRFLRIRGNPDMTSMQEFCRHTVTFLKKKGREGRGGVKNSNTTRTSYMWGPMKGARHGEGPLSRAARTQISSIGGCNGM